MALIPGLETANWTGIVGQAMYWILLILMVIFLIMVFVAIYFYISHDIKATVFPLYGSGKDGIFSIGKPKTNRIKKIKKGNIWKSLFPLFNKGLISANNLLN